MRRSRSAVVRRSLMIVGFVSLVAGCSQTTSTTTTTTSPTTTSTSTTLAATTSTTTTSSTTTTTSSQPSLCLAGQLKVVAMEGTGAAGSIFSPVNVLDTSTTACTLDGRPGVKLVGAVQGAQPASLHTTILTTGQGSVFGIAPALLTLSPGGAADVGFMVESSDVPSNGEQTCPVVSSMEVTLPGTTTTFTVDESFTACGGPTISVSAIVPESDLQST